MYVTDSFEKLAELLQRLVDSLGFSNDPSQESRIIFEMLENALNNNLFEEFLEALTNSGKTPADLIRSVIIDHSKALLKELVTAWIKIQRSVIELLEAIEDVSQQALDEVCQIIMESVARHMTALEKEEAKKVYGSTFNYNTIYFSDKGIINDVVFGVQDYFNGHPNSRAFVTFKLVNHDIGDGPLTNSVMIHELCHVWQYQTAGPIYMIQAIHAQTMGAGYNYGGAAALTAAINNNPGLTPAEVFELFNREQQADIIMDYYDRKHVAVPPLNVSAWQPFADLVYTPV